MRFAGGKGATFSPNGERGGREPPVFETANRTGSGPSPLAHPIGQGADAPRSLIQSDRERTILDRDRRASHCEKTLPFATMELCAKSGGHFSRPMGAASGPRGGRSLEPVRS